MVLGSVQVHVKGRAGIGFAPEKSPWVVRLCLLNFSFSPFRTP